MKLKTILVPAFFIGSVCGAFCFRESDQKESSDQLELSSNKLESLPIPDEKTFQLPVYMIVGERFNHFITLKMKRKTNDYRPPKTFTKCGWKGRRD